MAIGLTVSYGTITSDDTDYMLILDDLNFSGSIFTINPSFSYFVKDNLSFGCPLRLLEDGPGISTTPHWTSGKPTT